MLFLQILASGRWFFTHSFETMIIMGFFLTIIGFLVGSSLWSRSRDESRRLDKINDSLRTQQSKLKESNEKLSTQLGLLG